jgi:hypothetical protein
MLLSKIQAFLFCLILLILPVLSYKLLWICNSHATNGTMCFMGKSQDGQMVREYPVIRFSSNGRDTVFFNGTENANFNAGVTVPVRFQKSNPSAARINNFTGIWMDTVLYISVPLVFLIIVFLHPDIIPGKSKIALGLHPLVKIHNFPGSS